ncbi:MAG: hypothetical protein CR975_05410 [Gammaproteobacteria bacterium]|nr:MAG: hypothetical protein CR975_05410 [Gammaproteobacteria bacterium]
MNKTRLKFIGSAALVMTTLGVLLAILGQLDFIGNPRPENVSVKKQQPISNNNRPKYSFYDELKKRKVELDNQRNLSTVETKKQNNHYYYVVQVGALSKQADANKQKKTLESLGYSVRILQTKRKYLIQVGPLKGKQLAIETEKTLKSKKYQTLIKRLQ